MKRIILAAGIAASLVSPAFAQYSGGGSKDLAKIETMDPTALYKQAVDHIQKKNFASAVPLLREVLQKRESDPASNYMMGVAQIGLNDLPEARRYLVRAVEAKPDLVDALGRLGWVDGKLGNTADAAKHRATLAGLKAKCAGKCPEAASIDTAISVVDSAAAPAAKPAVSVATLFNQGIDAINAKKWPEAIAAFDGVLAQKPDDYEASFMKGQAQAFSGDYPGAKTSLEAALKLQPGLVDAKGRLGWVEKKLGNADAAAKHRADLVTLKEKSPAATTQIDAALKVLDAN